MVICNGPSPLHEVAWVLGKHSFLEVALLVKHWLGHWILAKTSHSHLLDVGMGTFVLVGHLRIVFVVRIKEVWDHLHVLYSCWLWVEVRHILELALCGHRSLSSPLVYLGLRSWVLVHILLFQLGAVIGLPSVAEVFLHALVLAWDHWPLVPLRGIWSNLAALLVALHRRAKPVNLVGLGGAGHVPFFKWIKSCVGSFVILVKRLGSKLLVAHLLFWLFQDPC